MASTQKEEEEDARRYEAPYSSRHPIPTVQGYREHRKELEDRQDATEEAQQSPEDDSKVRRAYDSAKAILTGEEQPKSGHEPYPSANRYEAGVATQSQKQEQDAASNDQDQQQAKAPEQNQGRKDKKGKGQSASEANAAESDPRKKRKNMKHMKRDDGGREITDPVTHLPITIYDSTPRDLKSAPENEPAYGTVLRSMTGLSGASKDTNQFDAEQSELQHTHNGMQQLFPPPDFNGIKTELQKVYQQAITAGLGTVLGMALLSLIVIEVFGSAQSSRQLARHLPFLCSLVIIAGGGAAAVLFFNSWVGKKVDDVWEDEVWDASREQERDAHQKDYILPESVGWLNSLLSSVWPLINPDLFTSISDMLEDVMQASLPKVVRMVSVDDLGQGNEAFRILGIKWLPTGAASRSVDEEGKFKSVKESQHNDREASGEGEEENSGDDDDNAKSKEEEQEQQAIKEGMEAEQGDFVNIELAFAYRAQSSGKSVKSKAKNAHLYLKFYLPGGICVPVWVEMRGIIGKMRLRLQQTPDPPFFSLCTLTFMGQPKADLSCIPISKHALNLMDVPLISSFVQSSIDAALAEYVAPKSLTLDLKDMLVGDDFKKDTISRGVVMIYLKSARDFKEGDGGIGPLKGGSSDSYATVSWGKFGKPAAATRIIVESQTPNWNEWAHILVSPEEVNAGEKLRIQLWDSDKWTADDDLGRVEVDLKELMHSPKTRNQMCDREDRFTGEDADEDMPGTLTWSVGYFEKTRITEDQIEKQDADSEVKCIEDLKKAASASAEKKMREAKSHKQEIEQQKREEFKEREDALIIAAPPPDKFPSGIFSIQIHNITGLEIQAQQKGDKGGEDEAEEEELPSSYATIIINHAKIYRTRTKPKTSKPFFNAGTERYIPDWKSTEVMISVRDDREREDDALLGMVYLPLKKVLENKSQVMQSYPLMGGMGYGRIRVSMVWRSVELKLPRELLGWDYGTIEVRSPAKGGIDASRMKLRTTLSRAKMTHDGDSWKAKHGKNNVFLAVRKRYSAAMIVEFRKNALGPDSTTGFAILWLKDIPDEEEKTLKLTVWKGSKDLGKAETSCDYEGESVGEIELTLKFWRGLSGYHKKFASRGKNEDVRNVMECLDTLNDENEGDESDSDGDSDDSTKEALAAHTNQDSDGEGGSKLDKVKNQVLGHNDAHDGSRGPMGQVRDYMDHHKQLHRKHRGVMQWKGARSFDWMVGKVKRSGGKIGDVFDHSEKGGGVETEV